MNLNGPFTPGVDYLGGELEIEFGEMISDFAITISGPDLERHRYFSFKIQQQMGIRLSEMVYLYVQYNGTTKVLPSKSSSKQGYEYLEYRVRISRNLETPIILGFMFPGYGPNLVQIKELVFSPYVDDLDSVYLEQNLIIEPGLRGTVTPINRVFPTYSGEIIDLNIFPHLGYEVKLIEVQGTLYDEAGKLYKSHFVPDTLEYKVQYLTPFDGAKVLIHYGRLI